jgi:hypothetical protein
LMEGSRETAIHGLGLLETGLHEDHAQFGGGFADELAIAFRVGGIVEGDQLVGDVAAAAGESKDADAQGLGNRNEIASPGAAGFVKDLADGFEDLGGVLGDEADGFAIDDDAVFADGGLDGEILPGRDTDELGEFEVDGAEAVEEGDEAVGVASADGEVGAAETLPGFGEGAVELLVVDAAEELGVGGGTTSGDGGEGAALAEDAAEVEGLAGNGELRCVHGNSRAPKATTVAGWKRSVLLIINMLSRTEPEKTGQVCLVCPCSPVKRSGPPDSMVRLGLVEFLGPRRRRAM